MECATSVEHISRDIDWGAHADDVPSSVLGLMMEQTPKNIARSVCVQKFEEEEMTWKKKPLGGKIEPA